MIRNLNALFGPCDHQDVVRFALPWDLRAKRGLKSTAVFLREVFVANADKLDHSATG